MVAACCADVGSNTLITCLFLTSIVDPICSCGTVHFCMMRSPLFHCISLSVLFPVIVSQLLPPPACHVFPTRTPFVQCAIFGIDVIISPPGGVSLVSCGFASSVETRVSIATIVDKLAFNTNEPSV